MVRIIDKIIARREEYAWERDHQPPNDDVGGDQRHDPSKIEPPGWDGDCDEAQQQDPNKDIKPGWYYSFEYFPPKTEAGLDNLLTRIDRMSRRLDPLFVSVTWGACGSTLSRTLAVASHAQRFACVDVLLHLSCTGLSRERIAQVLNMAKSSGIRNILALRGDSPHGTWKEGDVSGGECDRAIDLVKLIRQLHGDYFSIGVAGHPEGHASSPKGDSGRDVEMQHLKAKMLAGADFVMTQFFYDMDVFLDFVRRCKKAGIDSPIIAGVMPVQSYSSLIKMTEFCGISVPQSLLDRLEGVKDDDEEVKTIGWEHATEMCRAILTSAESEDFQVEGFHFYTLNLERSTTRILAALGAVEVLDGSSRASSSTMLDQNQDQGRQRKESISERATSTRRVLPWKPSAMDRRLKEDVRPINWSNRPRSYVQRTDDWDDYPNGRWGDSTSPAFGELSELSHFYSFTLGSDDDRRAMLGTCPLKETDVYEVFARYVEGKVPHIPWCETPLQPESFLVQSQLARLNRLGLLTVNSQPNVDGASSSHPAFGWGGKGGRVYQKAYVECFASPEKTNKLTRMVTDHASLNLYAVNKSGQELRVGVETGGVTALTWGAFPNREILQPTIFDPETFLVWAEEAFSLWSSMWLNLYDFESQSYSLVESIRDNYFLVAIIDNDFTKMPEEDSTFRLLRLLLEIGND